MDGRLEFKEVGTRYDIAAARGYDVRWSSFDNRGHLAAMEARGTKLPVIAADKEFLAATIDCSSIAEGPCAQPVTVYLRRAGPAFEVVGVDRFDATN